MEQGQRVAVYGTLKTGYENYERYLAGKAPEASLFVSVPFRMVANAEYPMLVPSPDGRRSRIHVEVFVVDDDELARLDALEAPYGYWRETVYLEELGADVGIYLHPAPAPEGFDPVPSGSWRRSPR